MTQIKVFSAHQPGTDAIENKVNNFLKENEGKIVFRDIKYVEQPKEHHGNPWHEWTVVLVYDLVEDPWRFKRL